MNNEYYSMPGHTQRRFKEKTLKFNYSVLLITSLSLLVIISAVAAPFLALAYMKASVMADIPHITVEDMESPFIDYCKFNNIDCYD